MFLLLACSSSALGVRELEPADFLAWARHVPPPQFLNWEQWNWDTVRHHVHSFNVTRLPSPSSQYPGLTAHQPCTRRPSLPVCCKCDSVRSHGSAGWLVAIALRSAHLIVRVAEGCEGSFHNTHTHRVVDWMQLRNTALTAFILWLTCLLTTLVEDKRGHGKWLCVWSDWHLLFCGHIFGIAVLYIY